MRNGEGFSGGADWEWNARVGLAHCTLSQLKNYTNRAIPGDLHRCETPARGLGSRQRPRKLGIQEISWQSAWAAVAANAGDGGLRLHNQLVAAMNFVLMSDTNFADFHSLGRKG